MEDGNAYLCLLEKQNTEYDMKYALVLGAGGFIGSHLVKRLKNEGYWVRGVDLKYPEFSVTEADEFIIGDLRDPLLVSRIMFAPKQSTCKNDINSFDEVYQLAADMGGAGYVFTGENDAEIMHNSALININVARSAVDMGIKKVFYSSSACVYNQDNQLDANNPNCAEHTAYPANPDSEYGWEKLFSERLYLSYKRNYNLDVRIARFHNIFGIEGSWDNGKEKSPAAICRKVAESNDSITLWGDGHQSRSFLYIDECLDGVRRLMDAPMSYEPLNIGSEEMISINNLAEMVMDIAGKKLNIIHVFGPLGVRGRNSDNKLIIEKLGWHPTQPLRQGMEKLYAWIDKQVHNL
jgi:GDP-D-mannose 3', 5'-epimerase